MSSAVSGCKPLNSALKLQRKRKKSWKICNSDDNYDNNNDDNDDDDDDDDDVDDDDDDSDDHPGSHPQAGVTVQSREA